jgi:hypothetical protein
MPTMEIPDRIAQQLEGETIQSAVNLGDEDLICFTPTRTILYNGEGLLSDESTEIFTHDVERLNISEGRRKTKFSLEYVDSVESFSVSKKRGEQVLQRLLTGILGVQDVIGDEETVAGVFLFSELTLVITEQRLVKHIGSYVWDPDFEEYPFSAVTGLEFEEGSVATSAVISVDGRPERIKAPSDQAKKFRRTLTKALFAYHEVSSLEELNDAVRDESETTETDDGIGLGLDDSISPLVSDDEDETSQTDLEKSAQSDVSGGDDGSTLITSSSETEAVAEEEDEATTAVADQQSEIDPEEFEAMQEQIATLTEAVEKQNEQLESQRETIETLIEELRKHV